MRLLPGRDAFGAGSKHMKMALGCQMVRAWLSGPHQEAQGQVLQAQAVPPAFTVTGWAALGLHMAFEQSQLPWPTGSRLSIWEPAP